MNKKNIANIVMKLYLYADLCKMIHYSTKKWHGHKQADDIRESITKFADSLAEQAFGFTGLPNFSDFSLRVSIHKTTDLTKLCQYVFDLVNGLRNEAEKNSKYSGIVSLIDDFKGELSNCSYLNMFDNVSSEKLHEAISEALTDMLTEGDRHRPGYYEEYAKKRKEAGKSTDRHKPGYYEEYAKKHKKKDRHRPGYHHDYNLEHPERLERVGIFVDDDFDLGDDDIPPVPISDDYTFDQEYDDVPWHRY